MRSKPRFLVGVAGFEPTASKSQTSRATSCATPRLVKIFNFSVKSVSGQICGQKFFAETHGNGKARKREKNGNFASFRRSAHEAVTRSQTTRATNCATPRKRHKTCLPKTACLRLQTGFSDFPFRIIPCLFPKVKIFWLLFLRWCSWHGWTKNTLFFCACLKGRENGEGGKGARKA